ncbi:MAG: hypothetical protein ACOYN4_10070 [Bacteroidales bacterium]
MKKTFSLPSLILLFSLLMSCMSTQKTETANNKPKSNIPGPKAIIYQTSKDYSKLVPVMLTEDKKSIESYPDIKDVFYDGKLAHPVELKNGYFLDNRGIGKNVAFISITYEEYSKLPRTPNSIELWNLIIDKDPIKTMYNCGLRSSFGNIADELNSKIISDDFSTFTKIK